MRQFFIASRQRQRDNLIEHQGQEKNINKYFKALCLNEVATPNVYFSGPQWHKFRVEGGGGEGGGLVRRCAGRPVVNTGLPFVCHARLAQKYFFTAFWR